MNKKYLKAEVIYRYLMGDDELGTLIMCKPGDINLMTTDQSLYEGLGSVKDKDALDYKRVVKLLENVDVVAYKEALKQPRKILTHERVEEIIEKSKIINVEKLSEAIFNARKEN